MDLYDILKRILDIIGSIVGIILFSPIMLVTAIYIKLVSPNGPVFADIPNRVGKNGEEFRMFKFRSMVPNAQAILEADRELYAKYVQNSYKLAADEDPRLIPGSEFIRKSSIDELPQFFNIFFGNMSLVGPRAYFPFELKQQAERFPETKEFIKEVIKVKPGLTGPWQVGGRSEIPYPERVRVDATYAHRRDILYDIMILLKTPYVVLFRKGVK